MSLAFLVAVLALSHVFAQGAEVLVATSTTEPVVLVDPAHPRTVVIGANARASVNNTYPASYYVSRNGGAVWTPHSAPLPAPYTYAADPSLAAASNGTLFFSYIGETPTYCGGTPGSSAILVASSTNGGRRFRPAAVVDVAPRNDKPFLAAESIPGRRAHVFVAWTRFAAEEEIWMARSTDGGFSFSRPQLIFQSRDFSLGVIPVVAPHHRLFLFWPDVSGSSPSNPGHVVIMMAESLDDGRSFNLPRPITTVTDSLPGLLEPGDLRTPEFLAATANDRGDLFVSWTSVSSARGAGLVDSNILLSASHDGETWTKPTVVNDVTAGDRFMPSLAPLPDGSVGIVFYDRRLDPNNLSVFAARAWFRTRLQVSVNRRVDEGTSPATYFYEAKPGTTKCYSPGRFFGDYIGAAAAGDNALMAVWIDTQQHHVAETDLWWTRVPLPRSPAARR